MWLYSATKMSLLADMMASVIRQYEEAGLYRQAPSVGDTYLLTIRRWYNLIEEPVSEVGVMSGV